MIAHGAAHTCSSNRRTAHIVKLLMALAKKNTHMTTNGSYDEGKNWNCPEAPRGSGLSVDSSVTTRDLFRKANIDFPYVCSVSRYSSRPLACDGGQPQLAAKQNNRRTSSECDVIPARRVRKNKQHVFALSAAHRVPRARRLNRHSRRDTIC